MAFCENPNLANAAAQRDTEFGCVGPVTRSEVVRVKTIEPREPWVESPLSSYGRARASLAKREKQLQ
jgi:hypothetical protein